MKIVIETTTNGYILTTEPGEKEEREVFEDTTEDEACFTRLAVRLSEILVRSHNKYGEDNINISWDKKGRKAE